MLSVQQVADIKGIAYQQVLNAIKVGKLPHRKISRSYFIDREDCDRWRPEIISVKPKSTDLLESILQRLTRIETKQHKIAEEMGIKFQENTNV